MITSAEEFVRLRQSEVTADYERAATDSASDDVWLEVIESFGVFASWVAHNKSISETIIRKLYSLDNLDVQLVLASKRRTPSDLLISLCEHENDSVRLAVAHNPKAPPEALDVLLNDTWTRVREVAMTRR